MRSNARKPRARAWRAALAAGAVALMGCATGAGRARSPLPAPRIVGGDLDATALLGELPERAAKLGAGPISLVASGETTERERLGGFVLLPNGVCLLAYARGSSTIDDIDVAAFSDDGSPVATDDAPDAHPAILVCPPHPDRVFVTATTAGGEGLVALGVQFVPVDRAADIGRALGARGTRFASPRAAEAWVGLDDHVRVHRERVGGKWEEFRRVAVSVDARVPVHVSFPLEADGCTDALVVPDEDVAVVEVEALDDAGHVLARAVGGTRDRSLTVCSALPFGGSLVIRPHVGEGLAAVVLARARGEVARDLTVPPDVAWASATGSLEGAKNARNAELAKEGYSAPDVVRTGILAIGRLAEIPLDLGMRKEACARVDVVAGAPLALLRAWVWDESGTLVTRGEGATSVALFACRHGKARLELEARGRPGPYASLVRAERWSDPAFSRYPLAASRMLERVAEGPSAVLHGMPLAVRAVALDAAHTLGWDESVPSGKCLRIGAGAEGEGTGLEGRVTERATGNELDRSHSGRAIGVRACAAPGASRDIRVEVRVTAGKLDLVIGERLGD